MKLRKNVQKIMISNLNILKKNAEIYINTNCYYSSKEWGNESNKGYKTKLINIY